MNDDKKLLRFLSNYGLEEPPQSHKSAFTDRQIQSLSMALSLSIKLLEDGYILDIGAGDGILLTRLSRLENFMSSKCNYIAIEFEDKHDSILGLAWKLGLHKRLDMSSIEEFYSEWPVSDKDQKLLIIIRNVFHELSIKDTTSLFFHIISHIKHGDSLIIQDLSNFPISEKGNVCWEPNLFVQMMGELGFKDISLTNEISQSGNKWFNIYASWGEGAKIEENVCFDIIRKYRHKQWESFCDIGVDEVDYEPSREYRVAKIDIDLQFASLTHQLSDAGFGISLKRRFSRKISREIFESIAEKTISFIDEISSLEPIRHFKDRANSQSGLQEFISGSRSVALIHGPPFMGKTTLVRHVLATFRHRRHVIQIDMIRSYSIWNLIEMILSEIGVILPYEVTSKLEHVAFEDIYPSLDVIFGSQGDRMLIVFDHFERMLNYKGFIDNKQIEMFLSYLASINGIKLILTSRNKPQNNLISGSDIDFDQPVVGRFPKGGHVQNLLGYFVGKVSYPDSLLDAIDRHPYMAYLSGKLLEMGEFSLDKENLRIIQNRLRKEILFKIATPGAKKALDLISLARTEVPRLALENIAGKSSVSEAIETGLIYSMNNIIGEERLACVGAIKVKSRPRTNLNGVRIDDELIQKHRKWAIEFKSAYKRDDDPRWIRESFFHTTIVGTRSDLEFFTSQNSSEIHDAGEFWFKESKNFKDALWAFQTVQEFVSDTTAHIRMRIASCKIRTGDESSGIMEFNALFAEYPAWVGVRRSYVDGLLFLEKYTESLEFLQENFPFKECSDDWIVGQYGRSYSGLEKYELAIEAFKKQLLLHRSKQERSYLDLARCYRRLGRRDEEKHILTKAYREFPESNRVIRAYSSWLVLNRGETQAVELLQPLIGYDPLDGWTGFTYVQALTKSGLTEQARLYFDEHGQYSHPSFLRNPIHANILRSEGHYRRAIDYLDNDMKNTSRDLSMIQGQIAEIYISWTIAQEEQRKSISEEALSRLSMANNNLPLNISIAKLALIAEDESSWFESIRKCLKINPKSIDLKRILDSSPRSWIAKLSSN